MSDIPTNEEMSDKLLELVKELSVDSTIIPVTRIQGILILAAYVLSNEKKVIVEGFRAPTFEEWLENEAQKYDMSSEEFSKLLDQFVEN